MNDEKTKNNDAKNSKDNDGRTDSGRERKRKGKSRLIYYCVAGVLYALMKLLFFWKHSDDAEVKKLKRSREGFIILSQHPSELDAAALVCSALPRRAEIVAGELQFNLGGRGRLFQRMGVIPKKQFRTDIAAMGNMMRVLRHDGLLAMMPEARISIDGTSSPIDTNIARFIKREGVPVAVLSVEGSYFVMPGYAPTFNIGRVSSRLEMILSKEAIEKATCDEIAAIVRDKLKYDQCAINREKKRRYGLPLAKRMSGVSNILYICPECGARQSISDNGRRVSCGVCGYTVKCSRDMTFRDIDGGYAHFRDVSEWNAMQIDREREYFKKPDAIIAYPMRRDTTDTFGRVLSTDEGLMTLGRNGFSYSAGNDCGIKKTLAELPGVSANYHAGTITIYNDSGMDVLTFADKRNVARFVNSLMVLRGEVLV